MDRYLATIIVYATHMHHAVKMTISDNMQ